MTTPTDPNQEPTQPPTQAPAPEPPAAEAAEVQPQVPQDSVQPPPPEEQTSPQRHDLQASERPGGYYWGTGRRKCAVARVRIRPGNGTFLINKRTIDNYFTEDRDRASVVAPLRVTETEGRLDVFVNLHGGGLCGQAGAVLLGVARALKQADPALEKVLRDGGFLTRDSRIKERKKYGQRGARRRFQFSKR